MLPLFEFPVTPERRREINARWAAIDKELSDLAKRKAMPGMALLTEREVKLLKEQYALEYELANDALEKALAREQSG